MDMIRLNTKKVCLSIIILLLCTACSEGQGMPEGNTTEQEDSTLTLEQNIDDGNAEVKDVWAEKEKVDKERKNNVARRMIRVLTRTMVTTLLDDFNAGTHWDYIRQKSYCDVSEFEDMDYYLFCNTQLSANLSLDYGKSIIIGPTTQTIEEAKDLYRQFEERLSLDTETKDTYIQYVSPDCLWVITDNLAYAAYEDWERRQMLLYDKDIVKEKVTTGISEIYEEFAYDGPAFKVVRRGNAYEQMEECVREQVVEARRGYWASILNPEGTLLAGVYDGDQLIIKQLRSGTILWEISLQEIQEQVKEIRTDEMDGYIFDITQFEGDEQEGSVILQGGRSSFFRLSYPSNEVTYLGEYLYALSYSPDGKYAAYSDADYDSGVDMEPEEARHLDSGIFLLEVETGKVARWEPYVKPEDKECEISRSFMWLEKDAFDNYMNQ